MAPKKSKLSKINPASFSLPSSKESLAELTPLILDAYKRLYNKKELDDAKHEVVIRKLKRELRQANLNARTDELTGLPNKATIEYEIQKVHSRVSREAQAGRETGYAIVLIDIDHFGAVNKKYNQLAGDQILRTLGKEILTKQTRGYDLVGRYGGEEFIVALQGCRSLDEAGRYAERLRQRIEDKLFDLSQTPTATNVQTLQITASIGVAVFAPPAEVVEKHLKTRYVKNGHRKTVADANVALHQAKESGRNQVFVYDTASQPNAPVAQRHIPANEPPIK